MGNGVKGWLELNSKGKEILMISSDVLIFLYLLRGVMDVAVSFEMVIKPQERLYLNIVSYDSLTALYVSSLCGVLPLLIVITC